VVVKSKRAQKSTQLPPRPQTQPPPTPEQAVATETPPADGTPDQETTLPVAAKDANADAAAPLQEPENPPASLPAELDAAQDDEGAPPLVVAREGEARYDNVGGESPDEVGDGDDDSGDDTDNTAPTQDAAAAAPQGNAAVPAGAAAATSTGQAAGDADAKANADADAVAAPAPVETGDSSTAAQDETSGHEADAVAPDDSTPQPVVPPVRVIHPRPAIGSRLISFLALLSCPQRQLILVFPIYIAVLALRRRERSRCCRCRR
jgi:hypothetical protein